MKQKRLSQTYNLVNDKMAISFGTVNKKNPVVVYISLGTWLNTNTLGNHKKYLISLEDTVRRLIKTHMLYDGLFGQRFILDYDVCLDPFRNGTKRFLYIDVYLKQNGTTIHTLKELLPTISERTSKLVDAVIDDLESNDFTVTKTKK